MPEPNSPLWSAVKAIDDSWPPDDEVAARDLGRALGRGADAMARGAQQTGKAGADALSSWLDAAGEKFGSGVDQFTRTASQVDQSIRNVAAHAEKYGQELESAKTTITSTIAANERTHAQMANPLLIGIGPALQQAHASKIAGDLRKMIDEKAAALAGALTPQNSTGTAESKGPNAGVLPVNPKLAIDDEGIGTNKYGTTNADGTPKRASNPGDFSAGGGVKGFANLAEGKATGTTEIGGVKLTGTATGNVGANGSAVAAFTQDGGRLGVAGQIGAGGTIDGRAERGLLAVTGKGTAFAGAEAEAGITVGKEGVQGQAGAFAGAKGGGTVGADFGGLGAGVTAEGWAGVGAEAEFKLGKGEDGKWHIGGSAGVGLGLGGKLGGEITVDPVKVAQTAADAATAVGDTARTVGDGARAVVDSSARAIEDAGRAVGGLFD
jgi:hypothetical protein